MFFFVPLAIGGIGIVLAATGALLRKFANRTEAEKWATEHAAEYK